MRDYLFFHDERLETNLASITELCQISVFSIPVLGYHLHCFKLFEQTKIEQVFSEKDAYFSSKSLKQYRRIEQLCSTGCVFSLVVLHS